MKKEIIKITLRLPEKIWKELKEKATENDRSLNSEIINRIK